MVKYIDKNKEVKHDKIFHYDVLILGGGPAGLTAAIYSGRYGLSTALLSKDIGGMANYAHKIENYPGYIGSGFHLMQNFHNQAKDSGAKFLFEEVGKIYKDENGFIAETKTGKIVHSKTLIIASGTEKRKLKIKGEAGLIGRGVSYCATCDAAFFKNKKVIVIGGGDSAARAALMLSEFADKVYISYRKNEVRCEKILCNKLKENKKIEFIYNSIPVEIKGEKKVASIVLEVKGKKKELKVDGVFVETGSVPLSELVKDLKIKITDKGYIDINEDMETSVKGLFAAGDVVKSKMKQIVVAAAQGAVAAKSAYEYVKEKVEY